jgi:hypothetical protein
MFKITQEEKKFIQNRRKSLAGDFNYDYAFELLENEKRKNIRISGYRLDIDDESGAVIWVNTEKDNIFYATPYWEGGDLPVELSSGDEGDTEFIKDFGFPSSFPSEKAFLKAYYSSMKKIIRRYG